MVSRNLDLFRDLYWPTITTDSLLAFDSIPTPSVGVPLILVLLLLPSNSLFTHVATHVSPRSSSLFLFSILLTCSNLETEQETRS